VFFAPCTKDSVRPTKYLAEYTSPGWYARSTFRRRCCSSRVRGHVRSPATYPQGKAQVGKAIITRLHRPSSTGPLVGAVQSLVTRSALPSPTARGGGCSNGAEPSWNHACVGGRQASRPANGSIMGFKVLSNRWPMRAPHVIAHRLSLPSHNPPSPGRRGPITRRSLQLSQRPIEICMRRGTIQGWVRPLHDDEGRGVREARRRRRELRCLPAHACKPSSCKAALWRISISRRWARVSDRERCRAVFWTWPLPRTRVLRLAEEAWRGLNPMACLGGTRGEPPVRRVEAIDGCPGVDSVGHALSTGFLFRGLRLSHRRAPRSRRQLVGPNKLQPWWNASGADSKWSPQASQVPSRPPPGLRQATPGPSAVIQGSTQCHGTPPPTRARPPRRLRGACHRHAWSAGPVLPRCPGPFGNMFQGCSSRYGGIAAHRRGPGQCCNRIWTDRAAVDRPSISRALPAVPSEPQRVLEYLQLRRAGTDPREPVEARRRSATSQWRRAGPPTVRPRSCRLQRLVRCQVQGRSNCLVGLHSRASPLASGPPA